MQKLSPSTRKFQDVSRRTEPPPKKFKPIVSVRKKDGEVEAKIRSSKTVRFPFEGKKDKQYLEIDSIIEEE